MPLAFASLLGGLVTLIGTPPNIVIATFRDEALGAPFRMFKFAPVGGLVARVQKAESEVGDIEQRLGMSVRDLRRTLREMRASKKDEKSEAKSPADESKSDDIVRPH